MADQLLEGKVAVVTGAGRGLGRSHALTLAGRGATVLVNDVGARIEGGGRDDRPAHDTVAEIQARGGHAVADTTDASSVTGGEAVVAAALGAFGRVDIVVNNAGVSRQARVTDVDDALLDLHFAVHVKGAIGTTKAAFTAMRDRGGSIVNTVSGAGLHPEYPNVTPYACAKAAVYAFTRVAAIEGAPLGIRVNAVSPLARTRMSEGFVGDRFAGRDLDPAHVSEVVVFLASALSGDLTGRVLRASGIEVGEVQVRRPRGLRGQWTADRLAEHIVEVVDPEPVVPTKGKE